MTRIKSASARLLVILFFLTQNCTIDNTIEWNDSDGYKWAKLAVPGSGKPGFVQLSESETGITFTNNLTKNQISNNRVLLNGSGVAIGDVDGDGFADIYFCRLNGSNVLYKNLGNWQFTDITDSSGVACIEQFSSGVALADIDGDEDLDLLVTSVEGPNACFLNDGTGRFTESAASLPSGTGASTMALADIDGDNDLDLYISNYKKKSAKDIWDPGELVFEFLVEKVGDSHRMDLQVRRLEEQIAHHVVRHLGPLATQLAQHIFLLGHRQRAEHVRHHRRGSLDVGAHVRHLLRGTAQTPGEVHSLLPRELVVGRLEEQLTSLFSSQRLQVPRSRTRR